MAGNSSDKGNRALAYWRSQNPYTPVLWAEQDINGDKRQELVLIYQVSPEKCMMCVIADTAQGMFVSESIKAPLENQLIKFQDIDKKLPVEIIVSGSKNTKYGYGIYRLEDNQLVDLFAEGMNDCC